MSVLFIKLHGHFFLNEMSGREFIIASFLKPAAIRKFQVCYDYISKFFQ